MALYSNTYNGRWATTFIFDSELVNVNILGVKRHGIGQAQVDSIPSGGVNEFYYDQANGKIFFSTDLPFVFDPTENDVFVLWKT
jgi:hypothetical protein